MLWLNFIWNCSRSPMNSVNSAYLCWVCWHCSGPGRKGIHKSSSQIFWSHNLGGTLDKGGCWPSFEGQLQARNLITYDLSRYLKFICLSCSQSYDYSSLAILDTSHMHLGCKTIRYKIFFWWKNYPFMMCLLLYSHIKV